MAGYSDLLNNCPPKLRAIWSDNWRFQAERRLWIAVLEGQLAAGCISKPKKAKKALKRYKDHAFWINEKRIRDIELVTRHDVKARIQAFNEQADAEFIHLGLTSADVVDNISLLQMLETQKFFAKMIGEARPEISHFTPMPFRGLKGPVGTQQDLLDIMKDTGKIIDLEVYVGMMLGFPIRVHQEWISTGPGEPDIPGMKSVEGILNSVGQVYPRSLDLQWASELVGCVPQSSVYRTLAGGFLSMITAYSGSQWNEGDVSTSVIRRIALPGIAASVYHGLTHNQTGEPHGA